MSMSLWSSQLFDSKSYYAAMREALLPRLYASAGPRTNFESISMKQSMNSRTQGHVVPQRGTAATTLRFSSSKDEFWKYLYETVNELFSSRSRYVIAPLLRRYASASSRTNFILQQRALLRWLYILATSRTKVQNIPSLRAMLRRTGRWMLLLNKLSGTNKYPP